jgi:hypothetical protein
MKLSMIRRLVSSCERACVLPQTTTRQVGVCLGTRRCMSRQGGGGLVSVCVCVCLFGRLCRLMCVCSLSSLRRWLMARSQPLLVFCSVLFLVGWQLNVLQFAFYRLTSRC